MKSFAYLLLFLLSGPLPMTVSADGSRGETSSGIVWDRTRVDLGTVRLGDVRSVGVDSRGRNGGHRFGDDELSMYAGRLSAQTVAPGGSGGRRDPL